MDNQTQNNFNVPYHVHNGVDSPKLSLLRLFGVLNGSKAFSLGTVANGAIVSVSMAIPNATLGNFVMVSYSTDLKSMTYSGYVPSAGLVTAIFYNNTGASVTIASGTVSFIIISNS